MKFLAKRKWITALTDGSYKQICSYMREIDELEGEVNLESKNMCVMGVLADVAFRESGLKLTTDNWRKFADDEYPMDETLEWSGLDHETIDKLISLNDDKKMSFAQFAKYIDETL